jgi:hypothetical protein
MAAQKPEVGHSGGSDENLSVDGHEDWLPVRSWGTICEMP